jgi:3-deoxy-D-manno-octulosonic-acid transferase
MIFTYRLVSLILYPFLILLFFFRKILKKEDKSRFKEKIFSSSIKGRIDCKHKLIWFHAASVGEVQSIIPIIEKLNSDRTDLFFLITTITYTSGKLVEKEFKKNKKVSHRYLPLDINFLIKKFLDVWKPHAIFFIDSEIWPNLIQNIKKKKIPLALINGRITYKTFNRWIKIQKTAKKIFSCFDLILTANSISKKYLDQLGGKNIFYFGNIKFSQKFNIDEITNINQNILEKKNFWCAASTHELEEKFCINTHLDLKNKIDKILTVIIPRNINRSEKIKKLCLKLNINSQIINNEDFIREDAEVVIVKSYGVLPTYYKFAKSVFIGKSTIERLKQDSGQNPLLAAKLGCKIYHGPYVYNFEDIYNFLTQQKISKKIFNFYELSKNLSDDFNSNKENLYKSNKMIDDIGDKILIQTTDKIKKFINYETN